MGDLGHLASWTDLPIAWTLVASVILCPRKSARACMDVLVACTGLALAQWVLVYFPSS